MYKAILAAFLIGSVMSQDLEQYRLNNSRSLCHKCLFNKQSGLYLTSKPTCNPVLMLIPQVRDALNKLNPGDCFDLKTYADQGK